MSPRMMSDHLVGMDARVSEVEQRLAMNIDDFRIIGLWGMGGVGKTTLAKACYQRFISSAKGIKHQFVRNINQTCEEQHGMVGMVQSLYSALLSEDNISYEDLDVGYRRDRLSRLRVFLVFDDVKTSSQLEHLLLGDLLNTFNLFALGSRIIVTTRNQRVLENAGAEIYHVDCLHSNESLQLFGLHAFRQYLPPDDWMHLSYRAISYCNGSPLAIKVLGGALFRRDKRYWESFLCELRNIQTPEIHDILRRSYDELGIVEKRVFLDTACFLPCSYQDLLVKYFSTSSDHVVEDLIDKSLLIGVSDLNGKMIEVHDLLVEMAWSIVNEESKLQNRTRLANPYDIHRLLTFQDPHSWRTHFYNIFKAKKKHRSAFEGGRATEAISMELSEARTMHLKANAFEGMTSLRFLSFSFPRNDYGASRIHLPYSGLVTLPDSLRWLRWDKFPSKSLPSKFSPENLVLLAILGSPTMKRCWERAQRKLLNLVMLELSYCINLVEVPNLSGSRNLEYLILRGCKSLIELPSHVQDLDKLVLLNLDNCTNLRSLPAKLNSKFLKDVVLSNCPKIIRCPEINSRKLETLNLLETPVVALPGAIGHIKPGGGLYLCGKHITNFPLILASLYLVRLCHTTIREMDCYDDDDHQQQGSLPRFVRLYLVNNLQLKSVSSNIWKLVSETLCLQDCPSVKSLPAISQPVIGLTELCIRGCQNLESLPSGIDNMKSLQELYFTGTNITSLPSCIQELDQLDYLALSFNRHLEFIPSNIHKLAKLSSLYLRGCPRIQSLPELPPNLQLLDVSGCESLQALPSNLGRLRWNFLFFEDCPQLDTKQTKEVVLNFPNHAALSIHPQGVLMYSGSEIPEWFAYGSSNDEYHSCMMVQLPPPNCGTEQPIKGIMFGVTFEVICPLDLRNVSMSMTCDCIIGTTAAAFWSSPVLVLFECSSDKVYIWYEKSLLGETKKGIREDAEPWYEKYAGLTACFRFSLQPYKEEGDPQKLQSIKIKRLGVSLLY